MAETNKPVKRRKPKFLRQAWNKRIRLGKGVKKNQKWRKAKGGDSKVRLKEKGYARKVSVGYGSDKKIRGMIQGMEFTKIENIKDLENADKKKGILIGNVGKKKREEILKRAKEKGLKVLNKYRESKEKKEKENATS